MINPVDAAREFIQHACLCGEAVDVASFDRVAAALDVRCTGIVLSCVTDLQGLCERFGFVVVADRDGMYRAYLPHEWPRKPRYRFDYGHGYWVSTLGVPAPLDPRWRQEPSVLLYPAGYWSSFWRRPLRHFSFNCAGKIRAPNS